MIPVPKKIVEIRVSSALQRSRLPDLDYSVNPYQGCAFACIYCYAMSFTRFEDAAENWGDVIYVKVNIAEALKRDIVRGGKTKGVVGVSTITDPYMPVEARYQLTRKILEILYNYKFMVSIQTKSPLVLRDLNLIKRFRTLSDVGMTITTMDPSLARVIEPRAPHPLARARALEKISREWIYTWIFIGPIIPGLNDREEHLEPVIEAAASSGSAVAFDLFSLYDRAWRVMRDRLDQSEILRIYRVLRHDPDVYWARVRKTVLSLCYRHRVTCMDYYWLNPLELKNWIRWRKAWEKDKKSRSIEEAMDPWPWAG